MSKMSLAMFQGDLSRENVKWIKNKKDRDKGICWGAISILQLRGKSLPLKEVIGIWNEGGKGNKI